MKANPEEIVSILREEIQDYDTRVQSRETGTVLEVGDGIATVYGLDKAVYGELVELDTGVKGMVMNLSRDSVGVVLLGSEAGVKEGTVVIETGADRVRLEMTKESIATRFTKDAKTGESK